MFGHVPVKCRVGCVGQRNIVTVIVEQFLTVSAWGIHVGKNPGDTADQRSRWGVDRDQCTSIALAAACVGQCHIPAMRSPELRLS
eukprot:5935744-Amphidinium_carterae.3